MKLLDLTLASPAENLACDESLLDWCENAAEEEILRFWEPRDYFVVVGYANKLATEVNVAACEARGIPVLRRCSGGGTVSQELSAAIHQSHATDRIANCGYGQLLARDPVLVES